MRRAHASGSGAESRAKSDSTSKCRRCVIVAALGPRAGEGEGAVGRAPVAARQARSTAERAERAEMSGVTRAAWHRRAPPGSAGVSTAAPLRARPGAGTVPPLEQAPGGRRRTWPRSQGLGGARTRAMVPGAAWRRWPAPARRTAAATNGSPAAAPRRCCGCPGARRSAWTSATSRAAACRCAAA